MPGGQEIRRAILESMDQRAKQLVEGIVRGDESAAAEVFRSYVDRLIRLSQSRLSSKLSRRTDPEDVVQSACRSFFRRARAGEFRFSDDSADDELWNLLAAITLNKTRKAVRRHTAGKRNVEVEQSTRSQDSPSHVPLNREPSPEEATSLIEETELMMSRLTALQRQILQLRLQGHTTNETALKVECSERTVRRAIETARSDLEARLASAEAGD